MEKLIPSSAFEAMPPSMLLLVIAGSLYFLIVGADGLVTGAASLANRLGVPKVIVGATIVSLGTTSPEAAVSVMAAWSGNGGLALGNAVGSIIADTGLIFGLGCTMMILPADRYVLRRQGWVDISVVSLLAILCYMQFALHHDQASLGRPMGILLLGLLVVYLLVSIRWSKKHPMPVEEDLHTSQKPAIVLIGLIAAGLVLVIIASRFLIGGVDRLAVLWGVPQVVIASTLIAFGTSLPELVVGITAIRRGHPELLIGNVIGADILNVLFVVGASAVAAKLPIVNADAAHPYIFLYLHLPAMIVMIGLLLFYISRSIGRGHFLRWYGYPLIVLYIAFVAAGWLLEAPK